MVVKPCDFCRFAHNKRVSSQQNSRIVALQNRGSRGLRMREYYSPKVLTSRKMSQDTSNDSNDAVLHQYIDSHGTTEIRTDTYQWLRSLAGGTPVSGSLGRFNDHCTTDLHYIALHFILGHGSPIHRRTLLRGKSRNFSSSGAKARLTWH